MTKSRLALAFFAALILGRQSAYGFECSKAAAPIDFVICSSPEAYAANEEMAEAWQAARQDLTEGGRATLVNDQRAWMNEATRKCGLPARGKPKQEIIVAAQSCVTREIHDRIPSIIRASTAYNFSQLPPAVELRCSPQTGEASIRIGSDEDEDVPPTTLPLRCELTPAHRLQIDWETTDLGAVLVHADDTLIGTAVYYGNHVMSVRDVYVSAKIETKSGKGALVVEVMGLDNICTRYSLDGLKPAEAEQHECDSSKMPPLHLR